ncbi:hypothetical protein FRC12_012159 [Ceratobasidium sp. 428]|nr:hypothetical protein FRC12_012159 [Ceratobasidium sp. 428]
MFFSNQHIFRKNPSLRKNCPRDTQSSAPNHEPAVNQELAPTGTSVADNAQNPVLAPVQAAIQGPNQTILGPAQLVLPAATAAAVINTPNTALLHTPVPPVQAPEPTLALLIVPPVANGNPVDGPLMRTLYGSPNVWIGEGDEEGDEAQGSDGEA